MSHLSYFSLRRPSPLPLILLFFLCLTPTLDVCCLLLHKLCAVFSACKQVHTSKVHYRRCAVCMLCSAVLMGTSRQLSLIRVTLTSQHLLQLLSITIPTLHPLEAMWHPAWPATPPPPACWVLSSHIALAEPLLQPAPSPGRLWDALTFV